MKFMIQALSTETSYHDAFEILKIAGAAMTAPSVPPSWGKLFLLLGLFCGGILFMIATIQKNGGKSALIPHMSLTGDDDADSGLINTMQQRTDCLGAPYLYVTVHGTEVLEEWLSNHRQRPTYKSVFAVEFRSMAIAKHKDHDALFIADASNHNSRLLIFGKCIEEKINYG
jgi:hypothetical protein